MLKTAPSVPPRLTLRILQKALISSIIMVCRRPPGGPIVSREAVEVVDFNLSQGTLTNQQAESARARVGEIRCKSKKGYI